MMQFSGSESTTRIVKRKRVISEMARVAKPGERLVTCIWPTSKDLSSRVVHILEPTWREGRLAGMGSASENRARTKGAGLAMAW